MNARAIARHYAMLAGYGMLDGTRILSAERIEVIRTLQTEARDEVVAQRAWLRHLRGEPDRHDATLTQRQWACLAEQATCHHLRGLTYRLLADGPLADRVPGTVRERLRSYYVDTAIRNALLLRQTGEAAAALAAERIPVLLLKGLHLARFIYPEPALRSINPSAPRDSSRANS